MVELLGGTGRVELGRERQQALTVSMWPRMMPTVFQSHDVVVSPEINQVDHRWHFSRSQVSRVYRLLRAAVQDLRIWVCSNPG
jgi:hypothetical protein